LSDRIFHIRPGSIVLLSDLIIFGGNVGANAGGGLLNENAQVQLSRIFLNGNQAGSGGFGLHNQSGLMILNGVAVGQRHA
jgi:hypothetical protein